LQQQLVTSVIEAASHFRNRLAKIQILAMNVDWRLVGHGFTRREAGGCEVD
jgi:hypothetical protein